jgi:sulfur carrier protein
MNGAVIARVNGEDRELPRDATVEAVVLLESCATVGIAVALNGEVVPRSTWSVVVVRPGDEIEILGVAAGG